MSLWTRGERLLLQKIREVNEPVFPSSAAVWLVMPWLVSLSAAVGARRDGGAHLALTQTAIGLIGG